MARISHVPVPIHELTDRQIHLHLLNMYDNVVTLLKSLEHQMADLNQSVADLEASVDAINVRFATQLLALQNALTEANDALAAEDLDDEAREQALSEALASAQSAADAIDSQVTELNAIGAEPETPVEPEGGDEPHPDQTLPGDLPQ
jgi:peptidoglycan hydrolase CwlO-like protein